MRYLSIIHYPITSTEISFVLNKKNIEIFAWKHLRTRRELVLSIKQTLNSSELAASGT